LCKHLDYCECTLQIVQQKVLCVGNGDDKAQAVITMLYGWQRLEVIADECMYTRQSLATV